MIKLTLTVFPIFVKRLVFVAALLVVALQAYSKAVYTGDFYVPLSKMEISEIVKRGQQCESPDSAMAYYTVAIMKYESEPDKKYTHSYVSALNNAGYTALFLLDNYNDAYYYLLKACKKAEETSDTSNLTTIYLNLANAYISADDIVSGLDYYRKSMKLAKEKEEWSTYITSFIGMAFQAAAEEMSDRVKDDIDAFDPATIPADTPMREYAILLRQGLDYLNKGDYPQAAVAFEQSLGHINTKFTPERYPVMSVYLKAQALRQGDMPNEAIQYLEERLPSLTPLSQVSICKLISTIYSDIGNTAEADRYMLMYYKGMEQFNLNTRKADLSSVKLDMDRKILIEDVERLQRENSKRRLVALVCALWAIVLTLVLVLLLRTNRKLRRSKKDLFIMNRAIAATDIAEAAVRGGETKKSAHDEKLSAEETATDNSDDTHQDLKEETAGLWLKISEVMQTSEDKFSTDFTVARLAGLVGEHPRNVSKTVNAQTGKNFSSWLTEVRINEACVRLADINNYGNLTISAIAEGLGFKSRTHFAEVFKNSTGLSPSEFQKIARTSPKE